MEFRMGRYASALGSEPVERRASMADMDVNIDKTGSDVEP